jgi:predicted transcriptional regulator
VRHPQDIETGGAARGRGHTLAPEGRHLQVMSVLWQLGAATVARVQLELNSRFEPEIAYNTVLTYLRRLLSSGWIRAEPVGRAYLYSATVPRDHVRRLETERITNLLFDGARGQLLVALVTDPTTSRTDLLLARTALEARLAAPAYRRTDRMIRDASSAER